MERKGIVIWLTGLSGAGKTTIARSLYRALKVATPNLVHLDGDSLREIFGNSFGYSVEERKKLALSYSRLCKALSEQGINVVCSTISLFREVYEFNRDNLSGYFEVLIDCSPGELMRRDRKGIYSRARNGAENNVIGVDLPYDRPERSDLVIDNSFPGGIDEKVGRILELVEREGRLSI